MASSNGLNPPDSEKSLNGGDPAINIAQAFQDLARGEKTAQTLESNLTSLEQKIDDLLKSFENSEAAKKVNAHAEASHDDRRKVGLEVEKGDGKSNGKGKEV